MDAFLHHTPWPAEDGEEFALFGTDKFKQELADSLEDAERKSADKACKLKAGSFERLAEELEGSLHIRMQEALIQRCKVAQFFVLGEARFGPPAMGMARFGPRVTVLSTPDSRAYFRF